VRRKKVETDDLLVYASSIDSCGQWPRVRSKSTKEFDAALMVLIYSSLCYWIDVIFIFLTNTKSHLRNNMAMKICWFFTVFFWIQSSGFAVASDGENKKLIDSAYSGGVIRVIVKLNIAYELEATLKDDSTRQAQRTNIKEAQDRLIEFLQNQGAQVSRVSSQSPYIVTEVDGPTLEKLLERDDVLRVQDDQPQGLVQ